MSVADSSSIHLFLCKFWDIAYKKGLETPWCEFQVHNKHMCLLEVDLFILFCFWFVCFFAMETLSVNKLLDVHQKIVMKLFIGKIPLDHYHRTASQILLWSFRNARAKAFHQNDWLLSPRTVWHPNATDIRHLLQIAAEHEVCQTDLVSFYRIGVMLARDWPHDLQCYFSTTGYTIIVVDILD